MRQPRGRGAPALILLKHRLSPMIAVRLREVEGGGELPPAGDWLAA
jgi:hypothetical protein